MSTLGISNILIKKFEIVLFELKHLLPKLTINNDEQILLRKFTREKWIEKNLLEHKDQHTVVFKWLFIGNDSVNIKAFARILNIVRSKTLIYSNDNAKGCSSN